MLAVTSVSFDLRQIPAA